MNMSARLRYFRLPPAFMLLQQRVVIVTLLIAIVAGTLEP